MINMDIILLIANMVILSIVAVYFARASRTKKDVEYTEWLETELLCAKRNNEKLRKENKVLRGEIISFKKNNNK